MTTARASDPLIATIPVPGDLPVPPPGPDRPSDPPADPEPDPAPPTEPDQGSVPRPAQPLKEERS
jgi:hypothetical protein